MADGLIAVGLTVVALTLPPLKSKIISFIGEPAQVIGVASLPPLTTIFSGDSTLTKIGSLANSQASP